MVRTASLTLAQRLGLPEMTLEEIAVLQFGETYPPSVLQGLLPPAAFLLDDLIWKQPQSLALRRLTAAHALLLLADPELHAEEIAQITQIRQPDKILNPREFPQSEALQAALQLNTEDLCHLNAIPQEHNLPSLDYLGLKCPMPIVRLSAYVRKENPSSVQIVADDRAFPADLRAWSERCNARIEWLSSEEEPPFRVRLRFTTKPASSPRLAATSFAIPVPHTSAALPTISATSPALLPSQDITQLPAHLQDPRLPLLAHLDYNDKRSPLHLVALQKERKRYSHPGVLLIETRDPQFLQDIQHWCEQQRARLLHTARVGERILAWIVIHEDKQPAATPPPAPTPEGPDRRTQTPIPTFSTPSHAAPVPTFSASAHSVPPHGAPSLALSSSSAALPLISPFPPNKTQNNAFSTPSSSSSHANPFRLAPSSISYANEAAKNPQDVALFSTSTAHSTTSQVVRIEDLIDVIEEPPLTLDFRGLKCPMPIVQLSKHMRSTNKPQIRVSADDPAFPVDLKAWCDIHGYEIQQQQQEGSLFHAQLKRRDGARLHLGSPKP